MKSFRVGLFLAYRQLRRTSIWTNTLIVFVMMLTFLNLVVVAGLLVGLIQGSEEQYQKHYTGDVIVTALENKPSIERTQDIIGSIKSTPGVRAFAVRYSESGNIKAEYKNSIKKDNEIDSSTGASFMGIDPKVEADMFQFDKFIVEGEYLKPGDFDQIIIGSLLLYRYTPIDSPGFTPLKSDVRPGSRVLVTLNGISREMTVKGILQTKVDEISSRVLMNQAQFLQMSGRTTYDANQIAISILPGYTQTQVRDALRAKGFDQYARIQTQEESLPRFLEQIKDTFGLLGNAIGSIGLAVASITIFIVIFVNIVTRRKYIGILKGIGVSSRSIEISYVIQSAFYALTGAGIGIFLVFAVLRPAFYAHPIDFPFSDGILAVTWAGTLGRALVLLVATIIAGYIPARLIVRRNTLDSILGR